MWSPLLEDYSLISIYSILWDSIAGAVAFIFIAVF